MGKFTSALEQYTEASRAFSTFSKTHNFTRKDIESLFTFSDDLDDSEKINGLKRNIIIRIFSLVESEIYHLNK